MIKRAAIVALLSCLLVVACSLFTPPYDPKDYPCGNPQMHYCPVKIDGERTCCFDGEDCGGSVEFPGCPAGMCCNARGLEAQHRRDGGGDG